MPPCRCELAVAAGGGRFQVSVPTAQRWAARYRQPGEAGMVDRPCRPVASPRWTPQRVERRMIKLRWLRRWGPGRIGHHLGLPPSTVHKVLSRYRMARLDGPDRATGRSVRRYEHAAPGDLVHVDVKKLGRIPDGGGHKMLGRAAGQRNTRRGKIGYWYLHNAVDDHSRLAYAEICPDERKETAAAFWGRAQAFFAGHGVTVRRVLTDNASCYRSWLFADALGERRSPADPAVPAPNQRQGRTVQPHPARRMGLRPALPVRSRPRRRPPRLAASLQSPPSPHLTRRQAADQQDRRHQPLWAEHDEVHSGDDHAVLVLHGAVCEREVPAVGITEPQHGQPCDCQIKRHEHERSSASVANLPDTPPAHKIKV